MNHLFSPLKIKSMELRNRIVMAPMCMYSSDDSGFVKPFHLTHYESRAFGGTGLVIIEATSVESRGRISANDLGIWSDDHIDGLRQIVDVIHRHGAKAGIQLAHAGRKCGVLAEDVIAPSPVWFEELEPSYKLPREMNEKDIKDVTLAFKEAARRADAAGFDVIEIHGAHGYLINEFLSPLTNKRADDYGHGNKYGSKFLHGILEAIEKVWPSLKPIFLRVSAEDYEVGGNSPERISFALNELKGLGIDVINVSSGGVVPVRIPIYDGYQIKFAETIKKNTGFSVMAGGRIKTPEMADEIIRNKRAELVFFGRQLLVDPYFAMRAAHVLKQEIDYAPVQYERWKTSL